MYILGINSAYHEPAACLIKDGHIVAAVEEERFTRIRHGKPANLKNPHELPENSIRYCLKTAGIEAEKLSKIAYSFAPDKRLAYNLNINEETFPGGAGSEEGEKRFFELLQAVPGILSDILNMDVASRFIWLEHHLCHASSAFYVSPFDQAAILSLDGIGEATCTWLGRGDDNRITPLYELKYPNSLGLLWTKFSRFLGFGGYGQWKVMGLAAYGDPETYYNEIRSFVTYDESGNLSIDPMILQLRVNRFDAFEKLFGPHREPESPIEDQHKNIAASLQKITNEIILALAAFLYRETGLNRLCLAGGVALNCVSNRTLVEEGPFTEVFIQPAANDAGTALGACYYVWNHLLDNPRGPAMKHVFWGPDFSSTEKDTAIESVAVCSRTGKSSGQDQKDLFTEVARLLATGEIVAWYQGKMEFGPRALGHRSILADPRRVEIVSILNDKVKHREFFRPLAASVLVERAKDWFDLRRPTAADAFMLTARAIRKEKLGLIPAVTHVDDTCRIQLVDHSTNPGYHALIEKFAELTGIPMLLNTSFNDREPIICSPQDAVNTCLKGGIRYLVMEDELIDFGISFDLGDAAEAVSHQLELSDSFLEIPVMQPFMSR